jgi:hypothetical protein
VITIKFKKLVKKETFFKKENIVKINFKKGKEKGDLQVPAFN